MSNSNFVVTPSTTNPSGIKSLDSIIGSAPFVDGAGNINMNGNTLIGSSTQVALTSDNTNTTCFIPFSKTTFSTANNLFIDNITGPLTYNPSTGVMVSPVFSPGNGNSTFSALSVTGLDVLNATSGLTRILNNQITVATTATNPPTTTINPASITCSSLNSGSTTTITPTSVTAGSGSSAFSLIQTTDIQVVNGGSNTTITPNSVTSTSFIGTATRATNIAGGLGGQIPYQVSVNNTAFLANGTAGQVLQSNGTTLAPSWATSSSYTPRITATGGQSTVDFFENGLQYRCHRFTATGSYTLNVSAILENASFDFCLIGGGGVGGNRTAANGGGGGGAGCLIVAYNVPFTTLGNITGIVGGSATATSIALPAPSSTTITAAQGGSGGNSVSVGNGGPQQYTNVYISPFETLGGSAGGSGGNSTLVATALGLTNAFPKSQFSDLIFGGGRNGGPGAGGTNTGAGGGGGNGGTGGTGSGPIGGNGGIGFNLFFDNTLRQVCGGGGGGASSAGGTNNFGGGSGSSSGSGTAGTANTGGGGGGASTVTGTVGGAGGSGLVMIRYVIG